MLSDEDNVTARVEDHGDEILTKWLYFQGAIVLKMGLERALILMEIVGEFFLFFRQ